MFYFPYFLYLVVHVAAHICNAIHFSTNFNEEFTDVNVANYKGEVTILKFKIGIVNGTHATPYDNVRVRDFMGGG